MSGSVLTPCFDSSNNQYADDCEQNHPAKPVQVATRGKYYSYEDSDDEGCSSYPTARDHGFTRIDDYAP
jgi:hypothetical protein